MDENETVGAVASTVKVALGPAARDTFPAKSLAVPAANEIPIVPLPVSEVSVTVHVADEHDTALLAEAPPVVFNVTLLAANVIVSAPV